MILLGALVALFSVLDLALAFDRNETWEALVAKLQSSGPDVDVWMLVFGVVGLLAAAATLASARISAYMKLLVAFFAGEVVVFGFAYLAARQGLLPHAVAALVPPNSFLLGVECFTILIFAASYLPIVRSMMRIADIYFLSRDRTQTRLWPLPYWETSNRALASTMLMVLVLIKQAKVAILVRISFFTQDFINALNKKDEVAFWHQLLFVFTPWVMILVAAASVEYAIKSNLVIRWRRYLTDLYTDRWLTNSTHYSMTLLGSGADNPDQRISEDILQFLDVSDGSDPIQWGVYTFTVQIIATLSSLVAFSIVLWTISPQFTLPGTQIAVPGFLFWVAMLYAGAGTLGAHLIGRVLTPLNFQRQRFEADFRYSLVRVRENSEQIALLKGGSFEYRALLHRFGAIVRNYLQIVARTKWLITFQNFFAQISVIIPYLVTAPFYFLGKITFGILSQTAHVFGSVQSDLSFFVGTYTNLASFRAVLARLTSFDAAMQTAERLVATRPLTTSASSGPSIHVHDLEIDLPNERHLVRHGSFDVEPHGSALVNGASGSGKSTLFRTIAGIWPFARGKMDVPADARLMLLPQRAYLPTGSLRTALTYPADPASYDDAAVISALHGVGLDKFAERLDADENWSQSLSGGEQQRAAVARALLARPDWLFLDEATSALDDAAEAQIYEVLRTRLPDTTVISIGHKASLRQYHRNRIEMRPEADGTHTPVQLKLAAAE